MKDCTQKTRGRCFLLGLVLVLGCSATPPAGPPTHVGGSQQPGGFEVVTAPQAKSSRPDPACAWYGEARDGVLYFGESAFWSAMRSDGSPLSERDHLGPRRIGRFDLRSGRMLPPLELASQRRSGTWDVLVGPDGRVYFTTFFDLAGSVDLATGDVVRFPQAGKGLNEWARGPGGTLLASRYAGAHGETGSLAWLEPDGTLRADFPLEAGPEHIVAPKTVAHDPRTGEVWITTDLLAKRSQDAPNPSSRNAVASGAASHPTWIVDLEGRERGRIEDVEIQFARFGPDERGYFAVVEEGSLQLAILPAGAGFAGFGDARRILLDPDFAAGFDFAQALRVERDGRVLVTTWSGNIHVVKPDAAEPVRTLAFPRLAQGGLYYAAASSGDRLCATYCSALTVVCTQLE